MGEVSEKPVLEHVARDRPPPAHRENGQNFREPQDEHITN